MKYEECILSDKPIWMSSIGLAVASLLPVSIFVLEGWHSGVPWAAFFAVMISVLMPGIYLIRPRVFWIWAAFAITLSVMVIGTIEYYWRAAPDWMDAEIPKWVSYSIKASIRLILGSTVLLGIIGWFVYFKRRKSHTTTASPATNGPASGGSI
jgi:hypothetical protein